MQKQDLVKEVSDRSNLPPRQVQLVVDATFDAIHEAMARGERVALGGFGPFAATPDPAGDKRAVEPGKRVGVVASPARRGGSSSEVGDGSGTSTTVVELLRRLPARRLAQVERQLREAAPPLVEPEAAGEELLAELELRNLLRVFARWRRVEERSLPASQLQAQLGVSRQRLQQLRAERKLLGLRPPLRREVYYPSWQFGPDGAPVAVLPRLLEAAAEARLDPVTLDALMTSPPAGDGVAPVDRLRRGDDEVVLALVRAVVDNDS